MIRLPRPATVLAAAACALALAGCGATAAIQSVIDPVAAAATITRAATHAVSVPGFRMTGRFTISVDGQAQSSTARGTMNTITGIGSWVERDRVGHRIELIHELFRGSRVYLRITGAAANAAFGGRRWLEMDMYKATGIAPGADYNPALFVDYLRTPGMSVTSMGTQSAEGVAATLYRANINLDSYPRVAARALRATARQTIRFIERATGSHSLKEDVWVDGQGRILQLSWGVDECVEGHRISEGELINLSHFGPQGSARLPGRAETTDLTAAMRAGLTAVSHLAAGCGSY